MRRKGLNDRGGPRVLIVVETAAEAVLLRTGAGVESDTRLEDLFDAHHERLFRLALRLCRDREEARDVVQEAFLRAARRPAAIPRGAVREEAWLARVLVNLLRDGWRRRETRRRSLQGEAAPPRRSGEAEPAVLRSLVVREALAALPPRRRAVVTLRYLEDRDPAEIARLLGVTQVTVRCHLLAGRRALARALSKKGAS